MLLLVPSRKPGLAVDDLGPAPIRHDDVLHSALTHQLPNLVVIHAVLAALVVHLILIPPMIVCATAVEEVAVLTASMNYTSVAGPSVVPPLVACLPVLEAVADLWV